MLIDLESKRSTAFGFIRPFHSKFRTHRIIDEIATCALTFGLICIPGGPPAWSETAVGPEIRPVSNNDLAPKQRVYTPGTVITSGAGETYLLNNQVAYQWASDAGQPLKLYAYPTVSLTASIAGDTLTVTSIAYGQVVRGQMITDGGTKTYGKIVGPIGSAGGIGTYQLDTTQTSHVPARAMLGRDVNGSVPLSISAFDTASTGSQDGVLTLGTAINGVVHARPVEGHAVNSLSVQNVGTNNGTGFQFNYHSTATSAGFDIGDGSISVFDPSALAGLRNDAKYDNFHWVVGPKDLVHKAEDADAPLIGVQTAEWNVTNRAADTGFKRDAYSGPQVSGVLLAVPEVAFNGDLSGLNASFAFSSGHSGGASTRQTPQGNFVGSISASGMLTVYGVPEVWSNGLAGRGIVDVGATITGDSNNTTAVNYGTILPFGANDTTGKGGRGTYQLSQAPHHAVAAEAMTAGPFDKGKFYIVYQCGTNSAAGETGRCAYYTGDTTGQPNLVPYAPIQLDGAWKHGIDTTLSTFADGGAIHLADGQKVLLDTAGTTSVFYEASSGKVVISKGGRRVAAIDGEGNMTIKGRLIQNGMP